MVPEKPMRDSATSPYSPIAPLRASPWPFFVFVWIMGPTFGLWGLAVGFVFLLAGLWLVCRHRFGYGPYAALLRLRKELPWLSPMPVLTQTIDDTANLRQTFEREGFRVFELDGATIRCWQDLADGLEAELGKMRFPSDPSAKCQALLYETIGKAPFRKVLIWRHAGLTARDNPGLVVEFTTIWAMVSSNHWSPFQLICDVPDAAAQDLPAPARAHLADHQSEVPEPSLAGLAEAPTGAWWKPKPGELTH